MARSNHDLGIGLALFAALLVAPAVIYPVFLMKVLCFALFACAFNLLLGYAGLLSFGHAMFFGFSAYVAGHTVKVWGWPARCTDRSTGSSRRSPTSRTTGRSRELRRVRARRRARSSETENGLSR